MTLTSEELVILVRVLASVVAGAPIGFERTFHGRDRRNADALSRHLSKLPEVLEFRIDPMGD